MITAIAFFLASIILQSFGEIVVLRHPPASNGFTRKLTCISEDDDAALIWNPGENTLVSVAGVAFHPRKPRRSDDKNCTLWHSSRCVVHWEEKSGWGEVSSAHRPMGPVFDYRWEGFEEIIFTKPTQKARKVNNSSDTVVFSTRGSNDVYIFLCEKESETDGRCFRIVLGSSKNKSSEIRSCGKASSSARAATNNDFCKVVAKRNLENIIKKYVWRTFTIKLIKKRKTIQVFEDTKDEPFLQGYFNEWINVSHVLVNSLAAARIRFHFYEYFESRSRDAKISTTDFSLIDRNFCIQLLVGLCPKCELNVTLVHNEGLINETWTISGDRKSMVNGMLNWRSVKLNTTFLNFKSNNVKLKIRTILNKDEGEGQWAIGSIHMCQSVGALRESTITIQRNILPRTSMWPKLKCQKLSDNNSIVVDSLSSNIIDHYPNQLEEFSRSRQGPCHGDSCMRLGKRWSLCSSTGCTCDRGFRGSKCADVCSPGRYGYNCNEKCGSCSDKSCNSVTGYCNKCKNAFLVPRLCKKELGKPHISEVTDYSAKFLQNVEVEMDERIDDAYFRVQGDSTSTKPIRQTGSGRFLTYTIHIKDLKPNTTYMVSTVLRMKLGGAITNITSPRNYFTTTCSRKQRFELVPEEREIKMIKHSLAKECGDPPYENYSLKFRRVAGTLNEPVNVSSAAFPYTFLALQPFTEYELNVSVNNGHSLLWTTSVFTLQSAPGSVKDLQAKYVSDTKVILQWTAPPEKDQEIKGYTVSIQREKMFGCWNSQGDQPPKKKIEHNVTDTKVSFDGLDPYSEYQATVIAHASKSGLPKSRRFYTKQKYIPTSAVHNLELMDKNRWLKWEKPEDCTTISGNISAAVLFIIGVSEWTNDWTYRNQTEKYKFDLSSIPLMSYTEYKAQVHVIRDLNQPENLTCYQERKWRTEAAEPHAVGPVDVYDADIETNSISLRWGQPSPPTGKIESYHVTIYERNRAYKNWTIKPWEVHTCGFRGNFICLENVILPPDLTTNIEIQIYARNEGVHRDGVPKNLTFNREEYTKAPAEPKILREDFPGHGVVSFKLEHPFSPTYITLYKIFVEYKGTRLQEPPKANFSVQEFGFPVKKKLQLYDMELPLAPSTKYNISIVSISRKNSSTRLWRIIQVPNGFGFPEGQEMEAEVVENMIKVKVPGIVNLTQTIDHVEVVVNGSLQCENSIQITKLSVKYDKNISKPRELIIDANKTNTRNSSCSLVSGEAYVVKVIVIDGTADEIGIFIINSGKNLLLISSSCVFLILVIGFLMVYCRRRYKRAYRRRNNGHAYPSTSRSTDNLISLFTWQSPSTLPPKRVKDRNSDIYAIPYASESRVVCVEYFPEYAKIAATNGVLLSQYMMFPRDLTKPCEYGRLPENISKNRRKNLIAYDDTRVVLNKLPDEPHSDYINANYVQGHRGEKAYIATQGPMPNTVNDFWRMVCQERVYVICMLTNIVEDGKTRCEQYWPETGIKLKYGEVSVLVLDQQVFADYTVRIIRLGCQKYKRKITHLHYTEWPRHGIPKYPQSLVAYLKKLREIPTRNGPLIVHCSSGVGRTGTLILCDICLRQAVYEKVIDVQAVTTQLRASRANMVGSPQQYLLAHVVIMESITTSTTGVFCTADLPEQIVKLKNQLPEDINRLNDREWQERVLYSLVKPRCPTPGDFTRRRRLPVLDSVCPDVIHFERSSTITGDSSNYIDAVSVDGLRTKKQYLASQLPSPSTWSKFWVIIAKQHIELIIVLQRSSPHDPTRCDIRPDKSRLAPTPYIMVEAKEALHEEEHFTSEQLLLTDTSENDHKTHPVTVLTCTGWGQGKNGKPPIPRALVSLWRASGKILCKESRTLVLCRDGITGCGLYLALSFMLERMAVDRECDAIFAVRAVRKFRPEFVRTIDQFEYLYDAAIDYAKCFETYSNFS